MAIATRPWELPDRQFVRTSGPGQRASQPDNMAAALKKRREHDVELVIDVGKPEPRATELDLYSIVVEKGFRNTADEPWPHKRLIEHLRNSASPGVFNLAWKLRSKLGALIDDVWAWETISDDLALLGQSRWERLLSSCGAIAFAAAFGGNGQSGLWRRMASTP